ncbi:MAG: PSK operon transcription factor [Gaiellales bacterium]|nr:MAG: PSK operon transcription factor [Gaiellales bacterium]
MALSIRNPIAEKLAREVAARSGENITQAIIHSLEERLDRLKGSRRAAEKGKELLAIAKRCSSLPDQDPRTADEILGYNEHGVS